MITDPRSSFWRKPWVRVRNTESEAIPPYAVMQPTGATMHRGELVITVCKPDSTGTDWYLVNGPFAIPSTSDHEPNPEGFGTFLTTGGYAMVASSSYTLGDTAAPTSGQWYLTEGTGNFYIFGGSETVAGNAVAVAVQGSTAGGAAVIQLHESSGNDGDLIAANASGYHNGRVVTWNGSAEVVGADVWLRLVDYEDSDSGDVIGEQHRYYGGAVLNGTATVGATTRPLYVATVAEQTFNAKTTGGLSQGASGSFDLYHRNPEVDSGINKTARCLYGGVSANKWCVVSRLRGGVWYASQVECD